MNFKKLLCVVLCIAMVLGTMGFTVFAEETATVLPQADEGVITLGENVELNEPLIIAEGESLTLDLAGFEITTALDPSRTNGHYYAIKNYGTLIINDSSSGAGAIKARGVWNEQGGVMTINGGSFYAIDIDGGSAIWNDGAKLTINGGKFYKTFEELTYNYALRMNRGEVTINDAYVEGSHGALDVSGADVVVGNGEFICVGTKGSTDNIVYVTAGSLNVKDGTFTHKGADVNADSGAAVVASSGGTGTINISGGAFVGLNGALSGNENTIVTGGTFVNGAYSSNAYDDVSEYLPEGYEYNAETGEVVSTEVEETPVAIVNGVEYTDLQEAIKAAAPAGTVELLSDVTVDEWVMFSQRLSIGSGQIITLDMNGLTIDGNSYTLTVNSIESATNGDRLFHEADKLNIKDLTIKYADGVVGGISLKSGELSNVTFNGGVGVLPGAGDITITGCTFKTSGSAIYNEEERDNLVVTGNHFETAEGQYAIYLRGNTTFTGNTVVTGKVNVTNSATGEISGNDFGNERFKVYNGAAATISNNTINNLVFHDESEVKSTFSGNTLSQKAEEALENAGVTEVITGLNGSGTAEDPYLINSIDELKWFRDDVNNGNNYSRKYVKLTANIDLGSEEWTPIGNSLTTKFQGTFDGGNYTISNLKITHPGTQIVVNGVGLFGYTQGATIQNLTVNNANVTGSGSVAAVAGNFFTGKMINVQLTGNIQIAAYQYVGGLVGWGYATIENCSVAGDGRATSVIKKVAKSEIYGSGTNGYVGGICGWIGEGNSVINDCSVKNVTITTNDDTVGGICGIFHYGNSFTDCSLDTVTITAPDNDSYNGIIAGDVRTNPGSVNTYSVTVNNVTATADGVALPALGAGSDVMSDTSSGNLLSGSVYNKNDAVAKIGETKYATIADALAATQAGDEIILLKDVEGDINVPADITFNGNGFAVNGTLNALGDITFAGHTKIAKFDFANGGTEINIGVGACLEITGTGRMVIGHGCTFNIEGNIVDAKTANVAELTPSLIMPGASFTGAGVTFNVKNAYIKTTASYCSSSKSASGTFDFNIENSIWEQFGKFAMEAQSENATCDFNLIDSVMTTTSHLVFGLTGGNVVIDNSVVNEGVYRQLENRGNMTIKNGSVVYASVATSSNAKNPGTTIVDNATYKTTGEFSGSDLGTGTLIVKNGAKFSTGKITKANITIDAEGLTAGEVDMIDADLSGLAGEISVINNTLGAKIENGKIVLVAAPVAKIGDTTYTSLQAAVDAAQGGDTIILLADAEETVTINKNITLDLNGYTITSGESTIIVDGGKLTIKDSTNGSGKVVTTATTEANEAIAVKNNGKLTLESGIIESGHTSIYVYSTGGNVVMTGGMISAPSYSIIVGTGTANISGGSVSGAVYAFADYNGTATISGGNFDRIPEADYIAALHSVKEITIDGKTWYQVSSSEKIAFINGEGFYTIADAIEKAHTGDTIIVNSCIITGDVSVNKDVTVQAADGATVKINGKLNITADGATVKGLTVVSGGTALYINAKDILVEGCEITGSNGLYQSYTDGTVTFKDSTITGSIYGIHFDGSAGGNIVIDNCDITGWTSFAASIDKVTISDSEFKSGNYNVLRFYQDAEVANTTFTPGMCIDSGNDGAGMQGIDLKFNNCSMTDDSDFKKVFPSEVIAESDVYINNVLLGQVDVAKIGETTYTSLQEALDAAAAGTGNVTVEIISDIDLTGVDWNPVTVSAPGYPVVTVNGNDKTITGLNDMLFAGTWAGGSGLIINNLTIKDSNIEHDVEDAAGNIGVGAFIGYPQASAVITLNDCHLVDSTVNGGHWTGGLIGMAGGYNGNDGPVFMNLTITGCSVTGSTVTGRGSAGGVIGHGSCAAWTNVVIENTTVSGNTVTSTGSSTNKAGAVMGTIGAAGQAATANGETKTGGASVSANVSDNTVTSNGTAITTIYGRQGTSTGNLVVSGGTYEHYPIEENVSYANPADGYVITENADGTYGVQEKPEETANPFKDAPLFLAGLPDETVDGVIYHPVYMATSIDSLNYKKVGFDYIFQIFDPETGETTFTAPYTTETNEVYSSISDANTTYTVDSIGGNGEYLFMNKLLFDKEYYHNNNTKITITPYAIDMNDKKITGWTFDMTNEYYKELQQGDVKQDMFKEAN